MQGEFVMDLICRNDLYISSHNCISSGPSHTYFRKNTTTCTDYVIIDAMHASLVAESYTHELHPLNSSDHLPLSVHLSIPALCNSLTPNSTRLNCKAACDDGSITAYVVAIEETVRPLLGKSYSQPSSIDEEINLVSSCICLAASSFIPTMKAKSKKKKCFLNNPLLRDLS